MSFIHVGGLDTSSYRLLSLRAGVLQQLSRFHPRSRPRYNTRSCHKSTKQLSRGMNLSLITVSRVGGWDGGLCVDFISKCYGSERKE